MGLGLLLNLGSLDSLSSELWSIFISLDLAWKTDIRRLFIESDSSEALNLVRNGCAADHPRTDLVNGIREFLSRKWEVSLRSIFREANGAAH